MDELNITATVENLNTVMGFVEEHLEKYGCPVKAQMQVALAVEEIYVNIARYAYNPEVGPATIQVEVHECPLEVVITFMDNGKPYDPLAKDDPDIALAVEDRDIGGLGIFMVGQILSLILNYTKI